MSFALLVGEERAKMFQPTHDKIYEELRKVIEFSLMRHNDANHSKFLDKLEWLIKQSNIAEYDAAFKLRYGNISKVAQAPLNEFASENSSPQQLPTPPELPSDHFTSPEVPIIDLIAPKAPRIDLKIPEVLDNDFSYQDASVARNTASETLIAPDTAQELATTAYTSPEPSVASPSPPAPAVVSYASPIPSTANDQLAESKRMVAAARALGRFGDPTAVYKASAKRKSSINSSVVNLIGPAPKIQKTNTQRPLKAIKAVVSHGMDGSIKVIIEIDGNPKVFSLGPGASRLPDGNISIPGCGIFSLDIVVQTLMRQFRTHQIRQAQMAAFTPTQQMLVQGTDANRTSYNFGATGNNMSYNFNAPPVPQPSPVFNYSPLPPVALPVAQQATLTYSALGGPTIPIASGSPRALNAARKARKAASPTSFGMRLGASNPTLL